MEPHPESARPVQTNASTEKAKHIALRLLCGRAFTRREIASRLRQRGCSDEAVSGALVTLQRLGLIDDRAFAEQFVANRLRLKPSGRPALARDLKRRGVPDDLVADVLDEALAGVDFYELATRVLRSRCSRFRGLPENKALPRMFGFLDRRGFDISVAQTAAQAVWSEMNE